MIHIYGLRWKTFSRMIVVEDENEEEEGEGVEVVVQLAAFFLHMDWRHWIEALIGDDDCYYDDDTSDDDLIEAVLVSSLKSL